MKYTVAVFDMDGTILDTSDDLTDALNEGLRRFSMPERSSADVRRFLGNGLHRLMELAVPENTPSQTVEKLYRWFVPYYREHCAVKTKPYAGINEVIAALRRDGMKTAVVSNKAETAVKSLCRDYFAGLFDYAVGDAPHRRRKPFPDGVEEAIRYFGADKAEVIYIGDSEVDFQTARNAGVDVLMVGWGFREKERLYSLGASTVLDAPSDILHWLKNEEK